MTPALATVTATLLKLKHGIFFTLLLSGMLNEYRLPYFRAYTPRVMHFFACHKRLCGLYEGAGYTKSFLHDIMYHVSCGVIEHNTDNSKSVLFY